MSKLNKLNVGRREHLQHNGNVQLSESEPKIIHAKSPKIREQPIQFVKAFLCAEYGSIVQYLCLLHWRLRSLCRVRLQRKKKLKGVRGFVMLLVIFCVLLDDLFGLEIESTKRIQNRFRLEWAPADQPTNAVHHVQGSFSSEIP